MKNLTPWETFQIVFVFGTILSVINFGFQNEAINKRLDNIENQLNPDIIKDAGICAEKYYVGTPGTTYKDIFIKCLNGEIK